MFRGAPTLPADLETFEIITGLEMLELDTGYMRRPGSDAQLLEKILDEPGLAFHLALDCSVGTVAHVSAQAELSREITREKPEPDHLYDPANDESAANHPSPPRVSAEIIRSMFGELPGYSTVMNSFR
jgi:hypothetical protein